MNVWVSGHLAKRLSLATIGAPLVWDPLTTKGYSAQGSKPGIDAWMPGFGLAEK
jgi:hypothetical protein